VAALKVRSINAYLCASNLAHIPKQIAWNAAKRGVSAKKVKNVLEDMHLSFRRFGEVGSQSHLIR
jgi:hypothetical protein